ncbi:MAG: DNA-formamidopyrimidine glycosylase [Candidatus Moranbacteria bacterium RIFOXYB1_FULL_43_19]|nr:MAG: DNA-formamidopyrimidine glycosylase [Candidatus Moranbacteria bacterium RIFOXYB1_FULL_43_19]OGI37594.1 MAG: DNA-formamidopyrimidine glycosylase [Candidatus Moranbacteria bacterium RIFOXYD1_FULL_44_12]
MPELPEVQTVVDDLNRKIKGDTVVDFWSDWKKSVRMPIEKFTREIKGKIILNASRIGKNIFLNLSGGKTIYIHLKMTGHLLVKSQISNLKSQICGKDYFSEKVNQYIHHIFYLKSGRTLEFSDLRKFGKIILADTDKIQEIKEIGSLGVDAMGKDFTQEKMNEILNGRKTKIKLLLMDQGKIAGIGNIYVSEILFEAGILPNRPANTLKKEEKSRLYKAIKKVLKKAIDLRGTSDSDYRDTSGAPGRFQEVLKVYRRSGKKCPRCGTIIQKEKMGQRGTFFCLVCQK